MRIKLQLVRRALTTRRVRADEVRIGDYAYVLGGDQYPGLTSEVMTVENDGDAARSGAKTIHIAVVANTCTGLYYFNYYPDTVVRIRLRYLPVPYSNGAAA